MLPLILAAGAAGLASGIGSSISANNQQRQQQRAQDKYGQTMAGHLDAYKNSVDGNIANYQADSQQYLNTPEGVNNWLNPNIDYQMQQARLANNAQYAANGNLLSGAAMKGLQDRSQNIAKLSWQDAFNNMNASNNQGLGVQGNLAGMRNDVAGNIFNAQEGMASNNLNAGMGQRKAGLGDFLSGFGSGANAFGNITNAFRSSKGEL